MSEFPEIKQTLPIELQQPPMFTDAEASAVLQAQIDIATTRLDAEGNPIYRKYVMGATYDGTIVSVDEWSGRDLIDDYFIVRVGSASGLVAGTPLSEQPMEYGTDDAIRFRGSGTFLNSKFGVIGISASSRVKLPEFEGKVLFPIGEDGKPFSPAAKHEAETIARAKAEEVQSTPSLQRPEQVSVKGIRRFLRRK